LLLGKVYYGKPCWETTRLTKNHNQHCVGPRILTRSGAHGNRPQRLGGRATRPSRHSPGTR